MSTITLGVPRETRSGERRIAVSLESVGKLAARGFTVLVERGAGEAAGVGDQALAAAGATLVASVWEEAEVVLKVQPPGPEERGRLREGATLVCLAYPDRNPGLLEALAARRATVLALERVPRITRAQKMDVLSSMANLAGYRAVVEAAAHFEGFFGPQVTAAGSSPPARVLVIGAGVAGLAALAAARALGAEVRAFDTRAAAREQVESLGGTFLEVTVKEAGEGQGGYAKVMSPEFLAAELELFRQQARQVDVIITTALVPGARAPVLLPRDVVECLRPGSVVVDMAAEQGGNCELCRPGEVAEHQGVRIVGFTDLPSRMAASASRLFATNVHHLLGELLPGTPPALDVENEVVRPALLLHRGQPLPPAPAREPSPAAVKPPHRPPPGARPQQQNIMAPARAAWMTTGGGFLLVVLLFVLGRFAPPDLLQHSTVFVLACFVGWQVVWAVTPALHTPLMSVTNAISGIIIIGGVLQVSARLDLASALGVVAVAVAAVNVAGGFSVTNRMLRMFRREPAPAPGGPAEKGGRR